MSLRFQQTSKLSGIKLTLSKYDTKYSKLSALLDENSSDELESIAERRPKSLDGIDAQIEAVYPSIDVDHIELVSPEIGGDDPTKNPIQDRGGKGSTVLNLEPIGQSESQHSTKSENTPKPSGYSSSTVDSNSLIETESCIESVKTDSVLSFGNIHSISSLAESVLLFVDDALPSNQLDLDDATEAKILSKSNTSSSLNIHYSTSEKLSADLNVRSSEKLLHSNAVDEKYSEPTTSLEPEQFLSSVIVNVVNKPKKSSCVEAEGKFSLETSDTVFKFPKSSSENEQNTGFQMSEVKQTAYEELGADCKYGSTNHSKVSVAAQTEACSISKLSKSQSVQTRMIVPCSTKSNEIGSPIIKAMKLPSFLKDECTIPQIKLVCDRHNDLQCTVEDEISKLVNHHVYLTEEFLKRQHRMYIANCKAVKLLDKGFRENSLRRTCKCNPTERK